MEKQCKCGKRYWCPSYAIERNKYCSKKCFYKYRKIRIWNKGLKGIHLSLSTEFKKGQHPSPKTEFKKGRDSSFWKGNDVKYDGLHDWVEKNLGRPQQCEHCGITDKRIYHWSNKFHKYNRRKLSDWQRLCVRCHFIYDRNKFGTRKNFKRYK